MPGSNLIVLSTGQRGVADAVLQAAARHDLTTGGHLPTKHERTQWSRDVVQLYGLEPLDLRPTVVINANLERADALLCIIRHDATSYNSYLDKASAYSWQRAIKTKKPRLKIGLAAPPLADVVVDWLRANNVGTLYVSGPSEDDDRGIQRLTIAYCDVLFARYVALQRTPCSSP